MSSLALAKEFGGDSRPGFMPSLQHQYQQMAALQGFAPIPPYPYGRISDTNNNKNGVPVNTSIFLMN